MKNEISVIHEDHDQSITVLRVASAANNSIIDFHSERVRVSTLSIVRLNQKLAGKLKLHGISAAQIAISIQFQNDRTISLNSIEGFETYDLNVDQCTQLVSLKWSFLFDPIGDGQQHVHSVYIRISERPNPGLIMQKFFSNHSEDIHGLESGAFSPVSCKIDFIDGRFGSEILSVVSEWVKALPRAEPTSRVINWLRKNDDKIVSIVKGTAPSLAVLAYIGIWLGLLPREITDSVRLASAWVLSGGALFLITKYIASWMIERFEKYVRRICAIPVFDITAGDANKLTQYAAKSKSSMWKLAATGFICGTFKVVGIYFATFVVRAFVE